MFKNFFKKENKGNDNNKNILITSLLIHAAKIDDNYTNVEKEIMDLGTHYFFMELPKSQFLSFFGEKTSHFRKCGRNF